MPRAKTRRAAKGQPNTYHQALGDQIRRRRLALDMTQVDLAEKVAISLKYLGELERGEANPTADVIGRIADALRWDGLSAFTGRAPLSDADRVLRDDFAKTAEGALLPLFNHPELGMGWDHYDEFADTCYGVADAMLRARQK